MASVEQAIFSPRGLRIGTLAGAPIRLNWTWWIFAGLIMVSFRNVFVTGRPDQPLYMPWLLAAGFALVMLVTVLVHELSHALAARGFGWRVLDITVNLWGGYTAYDHSGAGKAMTPGRTLWISLAGPLSNVVLALIGVGMSYVWLDPSPGPARLLTMGIFANWMIAGFNLLPGLPLDGGRIVESAVWAATKNRHQGLIAAGYSGRVIVVLIGVVVVGLPLLRSQDLSMMTLAIFGLIGWMMWNAATQAIAQGQTLKQAESLDLRRLMRPVVAVNPSVSIADAQPVIQTWWDQQMSTGALLVTTITDEAHREVITGLVDAYALSQVPPQAQHHVPVGSVTVAVNPADRVDVSADSDRLLEFLGTFNGTVVGVVDSKVQPSRLLGAMMYEDFQNFFQQR